MNIFDNLDFYPTPSDVVEQMFEEANVLPTNKIILEPSAGKGDIVDYCVGNGAQRVLACEINDDLKTILATKCEVIGSDFFKIDEVRVSHIDMIVMNPPFSKQSEHILHAWRIAPSGCIILSLCNYYTIYRADTKKSMEVEILTKEHGELIKLGSVFDKAERKTDVTIGLVVLHKPMSDSDDFSGYFNMSDEDSIDKSEEGITRYNYVQDIVSRYVQALKLYDDVVKKEAEINNVITIFNTPIRFSPNTSDSSDRFNPITYEQFKKRLQESAWKCVFGKFKMDKYVTKNVKSDLNRFIETQTKIPFTVKNVYLMLQMIVGTQEDRMNKVLVEAFENICSFSHLNSTAGETWKTNSNYKINKRFIHPWICSYDKNWPKNYTYTGYSENENISDIVKALCFITGTNHDDIPYLTTHLDDVRIPWGQWIEWGFFRIRGYKKGTMHFEFLDQKVCDEFNLRVAAIKGWRLPQDTKAQPRAKSTDVKLF